MKYLPQSHYLRNNNNSITMEVAQEETNYNDYNDSNKEYAAEISQDPVMVSNKIKDQFADNKELIRFLKYQISSKIPNSTMFKINI